MTRAAVELIGDTLAPARGQGWHGGPTPVGAVRGVSAAAAHWTPAPGRASIWGLTLHIAYWKYTIRRHLVCRLIPRFPRHPANFPVVGKRWTFGQMLIGVAMHDAYHTGQIQLLKRLWDSRR